ncbi:MAG: ABC transporter ATP-binding protein [Oscillospiraceae bacterium]|nr:ABC transporter ATP-binding protein [Oscillospiraceae bacterium]
MEYYFETKDLAVGYNGHILIHDINIDVEKGKILTLIGPNGAGKSTILKTITRQLAGIRGTVHIGKQEISSWNPKDMAKEVAVVLTDRIRPELMTCAEVVAMGRYPYTNMLGRLTSEDKRIVSEALNRVHAMDLAQQDFSTLSDGQRQRIMLARAICQQPEIIVLDEPTAYLDIRHKIELLDILREMAHEKGITVIMSLHEIDLAAKISDYLVCVRGETIAAFGKPEEVLQQGAIEKLYDIRNGSYNLLFGSVELSKATGEPKVFVIAGNGCGTHCYRALQKKQIPFATGILFENDVDTQVARELSDHVITAPAFEPMSEQQYRQAAEVLLRCEAVIDAGTAIGSLNAMNEKLLTLAKEKDIPIHRKEALL